MTLMSNDSGHNADFFCDTAVGLDEATRDRLTEYDVATRAGVCLFGVAQLCRRGRQSVDRHAWY